MDLAPHVINSTRPPRGSTFRFHKKTPILDFGPRYAAKPGKGARWLAWPAWAWRIVAPLPSPRKLNVFERAVFKLAKAGKRTAEEQADLLGLDRELTALVITELQGRGALDPKGAPTPLGERILEEDSRDDTEMVSGYVFQDPFSNDLWPRFVERLSFAECVFPNSNGYPKLSRGTTGNPREHAIHLVLPGDLAIPASPTAVAVVDALQLHFRAIKRRHGVGLDEDDLEQSMAEAEIERLSEQYLDRVDFMDEEPTPYFLLSRVYFPATEADQAGWRPCDPFGMGDSLFLRRHLEARMAEDESLRKLIASVVGEEVDEKKDTWKRFQERMNAEAKEMVRIELTAGIEGHDMLFRRLVAMERKWIELRNSGGAATPEAIGECLTATQTVIEALARQLLSEKTGSVSHNLLSRGPRARDFNRRIFEAAAEDCGFEIPLPDRLAEVKGGKVLNVLRGGMGSLRPLTLALLLTARSDPDHPVRRWAKSDPGFLVRIDELAERRDHAAHASEERFTLQEAQKYRGTALDAVARALDLPRPRNTQRGSKA